MTPESRFDRFKGHWFDASFLEEEIEGDPVWENPTGVRTRDIDWPAFLSGVPLPRDLQTDIALELERIDPPLMVVLPRLLKSVFEAVRRSQDAPGFKEIAEQLALLRSAAERLAAVAQGGKPRSRPSAEPVWWKYDEDDVYRKHIEIGLRVQDGRSQFLHPLLQDHLMLAMLPEAPSISSSPSRSTGSRATRRILPGSSSACAFSVLGWSPSAKARSAICMSGSRAP